MRDPDVTTLSKSDTPSAAGCAGQCAVLPDFSFQMAFQPVVDVAARRIYAYEALVRGPNGESAYSVLGAVTDENRYAFDQACRVKAIGTAAAYGLDRRLNINFLPNAVYHPQACLRLTIAAAREHNFPAELITFEFTENEQILDRDHLKGIIETYRANGFRTALDDFGAGYAGLSLLADFQPDIIKIDRVLVDRVDENLPRQAIIAGNLKTAAMLNLSVVAEGVERPEEFRVLRDMGINLFQGYLFAKPLLGSLARDADIPWI